MSEADFIRRETVEAWAWYERILDGITPDLANRWPPGTANSIGSNHVHVVINADVELGRLLYGRDPIIETRFGGDGGTGVPYDPDTFDQTWQRDLQVDWPRLREYGRAVHEQMLIDADALRDEHMTMPVDMRRAQLGMWTGSDIWRLHGYIHIREHGAEIACLKGLQGAAGYPPRPTVD